MTPYYVLPFLESRKSPQIFCKSFVNFWFIFQSYNNMKQLNCLTSSRQWWSTWRKKYSPCTSVTYQLQPFVAALTGPFWLYIPNLYVYMVFWKYILNPKMRPEILSNSGVLTFLHIYSLNWQEKIRTRSIWNNLILYKASFPLARQTGKIHIPCKSVRSQKFLLRL